MIHNKTKYHQTHQNKIIQKILASDDSQPQIFNNPRFSFDLCIDIGDGRTAVLKINNKTDPLLCSLQFCHDYNLDKVIAGILCQTIRQKIQNQKKSMNYQEEQFAETVSRIDRIKTAFNQKCQTRQSKIKSETSTQRLIKSNKTSKYNSKATSSNVSLQKQLAQCTHKPRLNKISQIITQKMGKKNILDQINNNKRKKQSKILMIKQQLDRKEFQQCSFKPKINQISNIVDNQINKQSISQKRYQHLYQLKNNNKKVSKQKQNHLTFKPQINQISKSIVVGTSFQERQQNFKLNKKQQPIYISQKPKTGRGPKSRNTQNLPIGQYLYNEGKRRASIQRNSRDNSLQRKISVLGKSENLINERRYQKLRQIFQILDKDKDGIIFCKDIKGQQLPKQIHQIFKPIFEQMKVLNIELDCKQFIQASQRLLISLTPLETSKILNTKKKRSYNTNNNNNTQQYTFKPKINHKNNNKKFIQQWQQQQIKDLYLRSQIQKARLKNKIQKQKQQKVRTQLIQCTFKPKIKKYKNLIYTTNNL